MSNPTTLAYAELQDAFDHYNNALFDGELPPCLITMQREKRTYGYFSSNRFVHRHNKETTDEIAINPSYFAVIPVLEILQTIVHEMAHQWQFHFGKPGRRGYHNKEWANKMESIGLMPSSTGQPNGAKTGEKMADYPIHDGAFMRVTNELIANGFGISWLDRFPVRIPQTAIFTVDSEGESIEQMEGGESLPVDADLAALLIEPVNNKSNRVKYRCSSCTAQVWGKPGLLLLCGVQECEKAALQPLI